MNWAGIPDETFDYDPIGNLVAKNGVALQYGATQPHRVTSAGATNYLFDANGSQSVRYPGGTAQQLYTYDRVGRLTAIGNGTATTQFRYDHTDRRMAKTRPDGTTIRYWGRYAESRDGRLIKYYWAGERMIASLDIPGVAYSEAPPGTPRPSSPCFRCCCSASSAASCCIEVGAPADLLIFREDPMRDLAALDTLVAVIADGRLYEKAELDAALARLLAFFERPWIDAASVWLAKAVAERLVRAP